MPATAAGRGKVRAPKSHWAASGAATGVVRVRTRRLRFMGSFREGGGSREAAKGAVRGRDERPMKPCRSGPLVGLRRGLGDPVGTGPEAAPGGDRSLRQVRDVFPTRISGA